MRMTIATLAAMAAVAALPSGAAAAPEVPSTCDLLENTGCDLQPTFCYAFINLGDGPICIRPND